MLGSMKIQGARMVQDFFENIQMVATVISL